MKAFRLFSVVIVLALMMFSYSPAKADQPTTWTGDESGTETFDCGTFLMADHFTLHFEFRGFYDNQGNLIGHWAHNTFNDTFVNLTTGKEVSGGGKLVVSMMYSDGSVRNRGLFYHVVVPGLGTVLIDAGILYAFPPYNPGEYILHGHHQLYSGDLDRLCSALK